MGDHRAGVSDLDPALANRQIDEDCRSTISAIHHNLDATAAPGTTLGCAYVAAAA